MHNAYVVTGTLTDGSTVALDETVPLGTTRVRLVVEPLPEPMSRSYDEVLTMIRQRQRGHQPPTREEVDAHLRTERDSWGD